MSKILLFFWSMCDPSITTYLQLEVVRAAAKGKNPRSTVSSVDKGPVILPAFNKSIIREGVPTPRPILADV